MSLAQAGCVLGMRLVPLPVGDEGGELRTTADGASRGHCERP